MSLEYSRYDISDSGIKMFNSFTKSDNEKHAELVIPNFNDLCSFYWGKLLRFKLLRCCFDGTDEDLERVQSYWGEK